MEKDNIPPSSSWPQDAHDLNPEHILEHRPLPHAKLALGVVRYSTILYHKPKK